MSRTIPQILIVDSDNATLSEIQQSLQRLGCAMFATTHSQQALDVAAREVLSLVICDRLIQADTGVRLTSLIRSVPQNTDVPFLFTSPLQIPDVISRRVDDRNSFFVRKSFEHEAFATLVEIAMLKPQSIPVVGTPHLINSPISAQAF